MSFWDKVKAASAAKGTGRSMSTAGSKVSGLDTANLPLPVIKPGLRTKAVYVTKSNRGGEVISKDDMELANTDILTFREDKTPEMLRKLAVASPSISSSVDAYIRTAITESYTLVAYNMDGSFNVEATTSLQQIVKRMDVLKNYDEGFNTTRSIRSLSESLAKDLRIHGSCACELVLDEAYMPTRIQPISVTQIEFKIDSDGSEHPMQKHEDGDIDLDIPNFFYMALDLELNQLYPDSPYESAIQGVLFYHEFINDLRRAVKSAVHSRVRVTLDADSLWAHIPPEYKGDPLLEAQYFQDQIADVESVINSLRPEDALVYLDNMNVDYMTAGNNSHSQEVERLHAVIGNVIAIGTKTPATILGQSSKSSNIASTETLLFMKNVEGAVQMKLNEFYSQIFTLAVRLLGFDVIAEFKYKRIDLRPEAELAAFRSIDQSGTLELLSLGLISDAEASIRLMGRLPNPEAPMLSGTGFHNGAQTLTSNAYTNTTPTAAEQDMSSDAPKGEKGKNGGQPNVA